MENLELKSSDPDRLRKVLGKPILATFVAKLRYRFCHGKISLGKIRYQASSREEKDELERLLGKGPSFGSVLSIDLSELDEIIRSAKLSDSLFKAIEELTGPIENVRDKREQVRIEWESLFHQFSEFPSDLYPLLKRLTQSDLTVARRLLEKFDVVQRALSAKRKMYLTELSAQFLGDSHALDSGTALETLCLSVLRSREGGDRRSVWASVGVSLDEVSGPLLVLNLTLSGNSPLSTSLAGFAGEPCRITLRQLLRYPRQFLGKKIFVCENPTVLVAIADALGPAAPPLICIEGQPKSAAHVLLSECREAGVEIFYHGDFDWEGIRIGNTIMERFGAFPWKFSNNDYLEAAHPPGIPLDGIPIQASWDPSLHNSMRDRNLTVHEEKVIQTLVNSLQRD